MKFKLNLESLTYQSIKVEGISIDLEGTPKEVAKMLSAVSDVGFDLVKDAQSRLCQNAYPAPQAPREQNDFSNLNK